jgi:hypothetical protein
MPPCLIDAKVTASQQCARRRAADSTAVPSSCFYLYTISCCAVTALTNLALNKQHVNLTVPAIEALVNMATAKAAMLPSNITLLPEVTAMLSMTKLPSVDLSAITGMLTKPNIDLSGLTVSGWRFGFRRIDLLIVHPGQCMA